MDISEFQADFRNEVAVSATADANFTHSAFVDVAIGYLEDAGEVADFEACYYRGKARGRNVGVDGFAFDNADSSVRLFIADPASTPGQSLTQTEARTEFGRLRVFTEEAIAGRLDDIIDDNSPARALTEQLAARAGSCSRIRIYLLTDATLSSRIKDWPEEAISGIPVEFHIWDITRFHRAHTSRSGQDDLIVDFTASAGGGLHCIEASASDSPYSSYLCVVPGTVLAEVYDTYGSRLLEGNVRAFLSAKGQVNRGIRNTILRQPEMLFAYNNGIAATATSVRIEESESGAKLVEATDFQIVNGGQTTASIAAARRSDKADLSRTFVPMKLSVIASDKASEMIPLISKYANSQNKVSDADFFSNHEYHQQLERISRRLWAPAKIGAQHETKWFYERARGQYVNAPAAMTAGERRRFTESNPRDQVITKTDLAKAENSWRLLPQRVSRGAQSSFLDFADYITKLWEADKDSFHEEYFRTVVARTILFRTTQRIVSSQSWYQNAYRANIVTYTIAKIAYDVGRNGSGVVDFRGIWQRQAISPAFTAQLADTARVMYEVILATSEMQKNVTQWCKRDDCWERAKNAESPLRDEFVFELIEPAISRANDREAKALQQVDAGIDAQTAVLRTGESFWRELLQWATSRGNVAPEDERLLRMAAGIDGRLPSDRQSKRLLQVQRKLEDAGFESAI